MKKVILVLMIIFVFITFLNADQKIVLRINDTIAIKLRNIDSIVRITFKGWENNKLVFEHNNKIELKDSDSVLIFKSENYKLRFFIINKRKSQIILLFDE